MSHASDFPACPGLPALKKFTVDNRNFWTAHAVEPLFRGFLQSIVKQGYDLDAGILDDWSYACRNIRESTFVSEHARGCAIDVNATTNPMGSTLRTDMPWWVPVTAKKFGLRWGGTYTRRPDAMHFEWLGTKAEAAALIASLTEPLRADRDDDGITPQDSEGAIRFLQVCLNLAGQKIPVDGKYGKQTGQAVKNIKRFFNEYNVGHGKHGYDVGPERGWMAGPLFLRDLSAWLNFLKSQGRF